VSSETFESLLHIYPFTKVMKRLVRTVVLFLDILVLFNKII